MAAGIYTHLTEPELIELRGTRMTQREEFFAGRQKSGAGLGSAFERDLPRLREIESDLSEIEDALMVLDPDTYGTSRSVIHAEFS